MLVISLFNWAKRILQHQHELAAFRRQEKLHASTLDFHVFQEALHGSDEGPHYWCARAELARLRRVCDEQRILKAGKSFWELENIDEWVARMRTLERSGSVELDYMWERLPTSAIIPLHRRMTELRHADQRARAEAALAAPVRHAPFAFHLNCGE